MVRQKQKCRFIVRLRNAMIIVIAIMLIFIYKGRWLHKKKVAAHISKEALKYIFFEKKNQPVFQNTELLRSIVNRYNGEEKILNADVYGSLRKDMPVLVVTVDKLTIYFEFLLVSLSQVKGIDEVLIIFSHRYYDENLNNLIKSIDFCRVLQIFYPYSIQLYPNDFPGFDPDDCPHNMKMRDAQAINCTGASFPDMYGGYRHPLQSENKHHWWWTANTVFETLNATKDQSGVIIFLNNDVYLLQDFLYMIIFMRNMPKFLAPCEILSLDFIPFSESQLHAGYVEVMQWNPTFDQNVLAFDISVWNTIVANYNLFCSIDDTSWARSLNYLSIERKGGPRFNVMTSVIPRAFKTSSCGFENKLVDCDAIESVYQILHLQENIASDMFPSYIEVYTEINFEDNFCTFDYSESDGGWGDPRDKELCVNMTKGKIQKVMLDLDSEFKDFER